MTVPRACVIGWPARHSRSPLIHGYWLQTLGLPGAYTIAEVEPGLFPAFVGSLAENGYVGANVTLPHKEAAFALCDVTTPTAEALGAANTLWFEDQALHGDNTDVGGFLANLDEAVPGWDERLETVIILGAGGVARAIAFAVRLRGAAHCVLVNRTLARAEELQRRLGASGTGVVSVAGWNAWGQLAPAADLIVNATSLGLIHHPPLAIDLTPLPARAVVADTIYVPRETAFLVAAKARGLRTVDGLGMLLHQAVPGFEHWFGVRPRVTPELRALVEADIAGQASPPEAR